MNKIRIILVDSGVRKDHPAFMGDSLKGFTYLGSGVIEKDFSDQFGHGTAVYGIVRRALKWAEIWNIRLPNIEEGIEEELLCDVLNYIANNVEADLINLSLGVSFCENRSRLLQACIQLKEKGIVIISAFDNAGAISYPAAFQGILGVTSGDRCHRPDDFEYQWDYAVNLAAKGSVQRLAWLKPDYILLGGNSFACAHATVRAAQYMSEGNRSWETVLKRFREDSIVQRPGMGSFRQPDTVFPIEKAVLFPFGKEMHSLLRFHDLLKFQILDIYDTKYSAKVGADVKFLMKDENVPSHIIRNIEKIEWDSFDTIIIGHLGEFSKLFRSEEAYQWLLEEAIHRGKQVVAFDDMTGKLVQGTEKQVYFPRVDQSYVPPNRFGKLYRLSKPIVGVFGTSSSQGKFTLQLSLRRELLRRGYRVGQLGTEPSALLYGLDEVYPMGYNSSVHITGYDAIRYLNDRMNHLCEKEYDIIIVGAQSGTVPYDVGNIEQFTVQQGEFLMGTLPDAVVLCMNPYDEWEYVQRSIHFIESVVECKVIALILYPLDLREEWSGGYGGKIPVQEDKVSALKDQCYEYCGCPLYLLGDNQELKNLTDQVLQYFEEQPI